MEFRLTYDGILLGTSRQNPRAEHKHEIRKKFHPQLRRLRDINPLFQPRSERPGSRVFGRIKPEHDAEALARRFSRFGYRFVPVVTEELSLMCGLEILFLRPDDPGALLQSGDLDNRLKTLFDALKMPNDAAQVGRYTAPSEGEDPFFVLLEDDRLITKVSVETDSLLATSETPNVNEAKLIITVRLRPFQVGADNIGFA